MPSSHRALISPRQVAATALILALASGSASAALVQVTITGTLNATDVYANTWTSGGITAITNQAYTAHMVYDTGIVTEARDGYPGTANLGYWDNLYACCEAQLYESFMVSSDLTIFGQTIAMDTNFGSKLEAYDQAGTDTFYLRGSDTHGPAPDSQDNEYIVVSLQRAGLFPAPFVANEAPSSPLSLVVTSPAERLLRVQAVRLRGLQDPQLDIPGGCRAQLPGRPVYRRGHALGGGRRHH